MRNDERLRTIYEVMAPYIVRNEHNWRDYLAFASQFHKHSFDNILLVYAQDEDVSILATRKQWAAIGRNLIPRAKGVAVCVYRNAKLTLDYLFDVSQTTGKEIHPTDWQLSDEMKKALTERLSYAHGFPKQDFSQALYAMVEVCLNYGEFSILCCMARRPGHVFSREQLYNAAWGEDYELGTNTVDNTIWRLRSKLEPDPKHPTYIKTVFRVGYKIEK